MFLEPRGTYYPGCTVLTLPPCYKLGKWRMINPTRREATLKPLRYQMISFIGHYFTAEQTLYPVFSAIVIPDAFT